MFLEAKKYRGGDFWQALRHSSAPFSSEDPKTLLEAAGHRGLRPVLLLDALNECSEIHRPDLLKGAQAFVLRYGARLVATSQEAMTLSADLAAEVIQALPPDRIDRRAIYAHHAGVAAIESLDFYCAGFANTYDLTDCRAVPRHRMPPASRADLYDRYIRKSVPQHASVVSALMRRLAGAMGDVYALALGRDTFTRTAEEVIEGCRAPLGILDDLPKLRFARLSDNHFAFEHELLFDYFRAEDLRRRAANIAELISELRRPRNRDLIEFILPRLDQADDIAQVLGIVGKPHCCCASCPGIAVRLRSRSSIAHVCSFSTKQWPTYPISLCVARRRSARRMANASLSMCRWTGTARGRGSRASCARSSPGTSTSRHSRSAFSSCWMRPSGRFGPPLLPPPGKRPSGLARPSQLFVSMPGHYGAARQGCLAVTCSDSSRRTTTLLVLPGPTREPDRARDAPAAERLCSHSVAHRPSNGRCA